MQKKRCTKPMLEKLNFGSEDGPSECTGINKNRLICPENSLRGAILLVRPHEPGTIDGTECAILNADNRLL